MDARIVPMDEQDQAEKRTESFFEELFETMGEIDPNMAEFEEIVALLSLPDDQFNVISELFLDELQKGLNSNSGKIQLLQGMSGMGSNIDDLIKAYEAVIEQIDAQLDGVSQNKRDFLKRMMGIIINSISSVEGAAKKMVKIPIQLCHPEAKMPTYANIGDAGLDVYALDDYTINPGETKLIPTGIKVAIPRGYELQVRPKSGRALKTKLRVANTPGTIDCGYRDEVGVIIENVDAPIKDITYDFDEKGNIIIKSILHGSPYYIEKGTKFAQLVLNEVPTASFVQVEDIREIEGDRNGGFGSSGLK
jgi:dUTP pyrophosphatase